MRFRPSRVWSVLLVAVGTWGGLTNGTQADQAGKPNKIRPGKTELRGVEVKQPMNVIAGAPLVEVKINGAGPFKLAIDTGVTQMTLDDDVVKKLAIEIPKPAADPEKDAKTPASDPVVRLISVALGDAFFFDVDAIVVDHDKGADGERAYDGVVGLPLFADVLMTLDYTAGEIILRGGELEKADGKEILGYTDKGGLVTLPLSFDGNSAEVTIATGYPGGFALDASLRGPVKIAPKAYEDRRRGKVTEGEEPGAQQMMGTVELGRYKLFQPPLAYLTSDSNKTPQLGHRLLQNFAVTVDQKNRRIRFARTEAAEVTFGPVQPKYGAVFFRYGRYLKVKEVIADSPAGRSPIKVGDKIEWIDGQRPAAYGPGELGQFIDNAEAITYSLNRSGATLHVTLRPWD